MKEEFLCFIWKHQYFDKHHLKTEHGHKLQVLDPGQVNFNAGPDFSQARVRIGSTEWVGLVEIHIRCSDWYAHKHHQDPNYDQVILHVVWTNDRVVKTTKGQELPTLVLNKRVSSSLLLNQRKFETSKSRIPCERLFGVMEHNALRRMIQKSVEQRLERKSAEVLDLLCKCDGDWDQVTYLMFGRNFGFHINRDAFSRLVRWLPLSIIRKVGSNLLQVEALLFGQAGLLETMTGDAYCRRLQSEYHFLKKKFSLSSSIMNGRMWKYLRLRPSNFPAVRIAQFAALMHSEGYRFSKIRELKSKPDYPFNRLTPSCYWRYHYDFGKPGGSGGVLGRSSAHNLAINTVVPLLEAYANYSAQNHYHVLAIALLEQTPAEYNRILAYWKDNGFKLSSALGSQGLLELNNQYCDQKKCLNCEVGISLITNKAN